MPPASDPIRGNSGILLKLAGTEYSQDVKAVNVAGEDPDDSDLTFLEAASGSSQVDSVTVTGIQSLKAGSLWRYLWDHPGEEVSCVYAPQGNAVITADKPHFLMTVKLGLRPSLGGEARRSKERYDFETTFEVIDGPVMDTTP